MKMDDENINLFLYKPLADARNAFFEKINSKYFPRRVVLVKMLAKFQSIYFV